MADNSENETAARKWSANYQCLKCGWAGSVHNMGSKINGYYTCPKCGKGEFTESGSTSVILIKWQSELEGSDG